MPKIDTSFDMPSTSEVEGYYANDNTVENHLRFEYASSRPHLGGFSFASAGRTLRGATQVQVNGTHEGAVAAVCQGRHHQSSAVPQVLIPVLYLSVHHAHWDAQVVRVIVQVLAAAQTVRQDKHIKVHIGSQHSHRPAVTRGNLQHISKHVLAMGLQANLQLAACGSSAAISSRQVCMLCKCMSQGCQSVTSQYILSCDSQAKSLTSPSMP